MNPLETKLKELKQAGKWIALSLIPDVNQTLIDKEPTNRCYINEGRDGIFNKISEPFYDKMVSKYDSRYQ